MVPRNPTTGPGWTGTQAPWPPTNLPPHAVQGGLAGGSLAAHWNPAAAVNSAGLWWYFNHLIPPTAGSLARVWVQPPYPIHRQRITAEDGTEIDVWGDAGLTTEHDGFMWARHLQVQSAEVRIITPEVGGPPWTLTTPFVWKYQHDELDANFQSTKGSAITRFYLPDGIGEGLWQVWPSLVDLTPAPP